jgi:hypothetical protein
VDPEAAVLVISKAYDEACTSVRLVDVHGRCIVFIDLDAGEVESREIQPCKVHQKLRQPWQNRRGCGGLDAFPSGIYTTKNEPLQNLGLAGSYVLSMQLLHLYVLQRLQHFFVGGSTT